jgi:hypothetical protein
MKNPRAGAQLPGGDSVPERTPGCVVARLCSRREHEYMAVADRSQYDLSTIRTRRDRIGAEVLMCDHETNPTPIRLADALLELLDGRPDLERRLRELAERRPVPASAGRRYDDPTDHFASRRSRE